MPDKQFIAVLDKTNTCPCLTLQPLVETIARSDGLEVLSATDNLVRFCGDPALARDLSTQFAGRVLIEENKNLTLDQPGPKRTGPLDPVANVTGDDDDSNDKDPNEIVRF